MFLPAFILFLPGRETVLPRSLHELPAGTRWQEDPMENGL
jgi:hypothetical protein